VGLSNLAQGKRSDWSAFLVITENAIYHRKQSCSNRHDYKGGNQTPKCIGFGKVPDSQNANDHTGNNTGGNYVEGRGSYQLRRKEAFGLLPPPAWTVSAGAIARSREQRRYFNAFR
jgi:hypothetical protein